MARFSIAHIFELVPSDRDACTFSDATKIRLPEEHPHGIALKKTSSGVYPTTNDIFVRGPLLQPKGVRQWVAVDAEFSLPTDALGAAVTSIQWKLNDGTDDLYWNGSAWVVAGLSNWMSLATLQANFATFPVAARKLRFVANLKATDAKFTPHLRQVRVAFKAELRSFSDLVIFRTLVPNLESGTLPQTDLTLSWSGGATIDLDTLSQEEALAITNVDGAYNLTDDPELLTNLKSTYDTGTKLLTLTNSVASGKRVLLRVVYAPAVIVATHPDYNEVAGLPAIEIRDIQETFVGDSKGALAFLERGTGNAILLQEPRQTDYKMNLACMAAREVECSQLTEAVVRYLRENYRQTITALDQRVTLVLEGDPVMSSDHQNHLHTATFSLRIVGATKWLGGQSQGYAIKRVVVTGDLNVTLT